MIKAIELAILDRLGAVAAARADGFQWRTLTSYPDDWDLYFEAQGEVRTPAAWVVFAGWSDSFLTTDPASGADALAIPQASFGVMVADENRRQAEAHQRHGGPDDAREPGSYQLALFAAGALAGQTLGLELMHPLTVTDLRSVRPFEAIRARKISMYAVAMTCGFTLPLIGAASISGSGDGADPGELDLSDPAAMATLHGNWDVPARDSPLPIDADPGAPGVQLPDDAHADATDIVSLETD